MKSKQFPEFDSLLWKIGKSYLKNNNYEQQREIESAEVQMETLTKNQNEQQRARIATNSIVADMKSHEKAGKNKNRQLN